jgi:Outer membrane protein beta-barrel domain
VATFAGFITNPKFNRMKLKFIVPSLALLFAAGAASAQISIGAQAGVAFAKSKTDEFSGVSGFELSTKNRIGFTGGLVADIPFGESGFRLMPELNFVQKGLKADGTVEIDILGQIVSAQTEADISLSYIDLPVNLAYAVEVGNGRLIVGAGPYASIGLSGRTKVKLTALGQSEEESDDLEFGSGEDQLKRMDFGANFMAGYIMNNGFLVKLNYSLGLTNLSNTSESDFKNRYFGLTVGYFFLRGGE